MAKGKKIRRFLQGMEVTGSWVEKTSGFFSVLLFAAMIIVALVGILFRYVMQSPFEWTEEVARFLMLVIVFLSINTAFRLKQHIAVTFFVDRLPRFGARVLDYVSHILIAFFLFFLIKQGIGMTANTMMTASTIDLSMRWLYIFVPIGAILTTIQLIIRVVENIFKDLKLSTKK